MLKKLILGSVLVGGSLFGSSLGININENTLEIEGEYSLNRSFTLNEDSNYYLIANYLSSEDETDNKTDEDTVSLASFGFKIINPYLNDYGLSFGLGIKSVFADNYKDDFVAVPLEFYGNYHLNDKLHFEATIAYAPKVLSFADGESYNETKIKANYQLIENGYVYIGGRNIKTDYKNDVSIEYDKSLFFGYKVLF